VNFQFPLPFPYSDATGSIPVITTMLFSNFNRFPMHTWPGEMRFFALPTRSQASLLAVAPVQQVQLAPQQRVQPLQSFFQISNINGVDGGRFLTNAVVQVRASFILFCSFLPPSLPSFFPCVTCRVGTNAIVQALFYLVLSSLPPSLPSFSSSCAKR